jgi:hypothetical protein
MEWYITTSDDKVFLCGPGRTVIELQTPAFMDDILDIVNRDS